jgi:glutaredoxin
MRIIHWFLGRLILFIDWLTTPKSIQRPVEKQNAIDEQSQNLILYQYKACPFCVKVRRSLKRLSLPIETRDPKRSDDAKKELIAGAGKLKVPCLKIDGVEGENKIQWLFDSKDIISYLERRFAED